MKILDSVKQVMEDSSKNGIYLPFVHDPVKEKPSVTLLFFYISFCLAAIFVSISSVMLIIDKSYVLAAAYPVVMMYSGFIFYRLRRLDSVKINLEEKSIDFDGEGN